MLTCPLCIARQLESIASPRFETKSKRYQTIFELIMCVGLPCLYEGFGKSLSNEQSLIEAGLISRT